MLKSSLSNSNDAWILVSWTIIIFGEGAGDAAKGLEKKNKGVIFNSRTPFLDCMSEKSNTELDAKKILKFWCQCIIWSKKAKIIQRNLEVFGNFIETRKIIF